MHGLSMAIADLDYYYVKPQGTASSEAHFHESLHGMQRLELGERGKAWQS
jgi:hypothetical protein